MPLTEKKSYFYEWLILLIFLIPSCLLIMKGINSLLFYMQSVPMYSSIARLDDVDVTIQLPEGWGFESNDDGLLLVNQAYSESMLFVRVNSANDMTTAKSLFLLSLKDSYDMELDLSEGELSGPHNNVYYVTYQIYTSYYVSGVIESNGIYMNFVYRTNLTLDRMSPITEMVKSIKFSLVPDIEDEYITTTVPEENETDNRENREGFTVQEVLS